MNGQEKERTVGFIMSSVPGKKNITNLIFMPANKCFGLILVTQNPLITNKVNLKLVTYFLVADIKIFIS